jgi:hypothetical protein
MKEVVPILRWAKPVPQSGVALPGPLTEPTRLASNDGQGHRVPLTEDLTGVHRAMVQHHGVLLTEDQAGSILIRRSRRGPSDGGPNRLYLLSADPGASGGNVPPERSHITELSPDFFTWFTPRGPRTARSRRSGPAGRLRNLQLLHGRSGGLWCAVCSAGAFDGTPRAGRDGSSSTLSPAPGVGNPAAGGSGRV